MNRRIIILSSFFTSILTFVLACIGILVLSFAGMSESIPRLNYSTSWFGNSFEGSGQNGFGKWVQIFIDEIEVSPEGTVVTAHPWDEAGRCTGLYRDGDVNLNLLKQPDKNAENAWGWGTGSRAVAIDGNSLVICNIGLELVRFEWNPLDINRWRYVETLSLKKGDDDKRSVNGLFAKDGKLYMVWADGLVQVRRSTGGFGLVTEFKVPKARDVVVDNNDTIWVMTDVHIVRYSTSGRVLPEVIIDAGSPSAISIDRKNGYLIVCDDGSRQQVLFYDIKRKPRLISRFGTEGGLRSGTPGVLTEAKLFALRGAGTDAQGNIYIAMGVGEAVLRKYTPNGKLVWELGAHHFVDASCFDANSQGTKIYGIDEMYAVDYAKGAGREARLLAITRDQVKYPNDPRMKRDVVCNVWFRTVGGRRLLYINGMYTQNSKKESGLDIYCFEAEPSQIAQFAGSFTGNNWAWDVDSWGNIWEGNYYGSIRRYPMTGFDKNGMPVYDNRVYMEYETPELYGKVERLKYEVETDTMYLVGFTWDYPEVAWGLAGSVFTRYDKWKLGNRKPRYEVVLPTETTESGEELYPVSFDIAGGYAFFVMCRSAKVYIYSLKDGGFVGTLSPGDEVGRQSGWVDIPYGIHAARTASGEYSIIVEEDFRGKNLLYRWKP